jgi:hypothetical protein
MIYLSSFACYFAYSSFCFCFFSFIFLFLFLDLLEAAVEEGSSSLDSSFVVLADEGCNFLETVERLEPGYFEEVVGVEGAPRISSQLLSS